LKPSLAQGAVKFLLFTHLEVWFWTQNHCKIMGLELLQADSENTIWMSWINNGIYRRQARSNQLHIPFKYQRDQPWLPVVKHIFRDHQDRAESSINFS
jgi:hypothetical protein